jgi:hypothetical protein
MSLTITSQHKLGVSERTETQIKIAAMQWHFQSVSGSWDIAYLNLKHLHELPDNYVPHELYRGLSFERLVDSINNFVHTMTDNIHHGLKYAEVEHANVLSR